MTEQNLDERAQQIQEDQAAILAIKEQWGDRLSILAHHYQRPEIVAMGDIIGDSYELSKKAAEAKAEWIVFCGVHFMAQSAAVLARPEQKVLHPNSRAGCPMAEMADPDDLRRALEEIQSVQDDKRVIPLTYMNSMADVKAVVGDAGGAVCTSSNARQAFEWAFAQGDTILFVPDEHLGSNTARAMNIPADQIALYDPQAGEYGGLLKSRLAKARLILWAGFCHVHTWFTPQHIADARSRWPDAQVYVHPECPAEVVAAADGSGSTRFLVDKVAQAEPGSTLVIGTEANLVKRLGMEYPDRRVEPLSPSICPNMARITLRNLRQTLEHLPDGEPVQVPETDRAGAKLALERMLQI